MLLGGDRKGTPSGALLFDAIITRMIRNADIKELSPVW